MRQFSKNKPKFQDISPEINYEEIKQYWKKGKELNPALFSELANKWAQIISERGKKEKRRKNKPSQLRKFYDEILRVYYDYKANNNFELAKVKLHKIIAFIYYADGRELITRGVTYLFENLIKDIENSEDFKIAVSFLEAFMGFYKYYRPGEN